MNKKEFAKKLLNEKVKAFAIYVFSFRLGLILIYSVSQTNIILFFTKASIINKYWDFINLFSKNLTIKAFEYSNINDYIINLKMGK